MGKPSADITAHRLGFCTAGYVCSLEVNLWLMSLGVGQEGSLGAQFELFLSQTIGQLGNRLLSNGLLRD